MRRLRTVKILAIPPVFLSTLFVLSIAFGIFVYSNMAKATFQICPNSTYDCGQDYPGCTATTQIQCEDPNNPENSDPCSVVPRTCGVYPTGCDSLCDTAIQCYASDTPPNCNPLPSTSCGPDFDAANCGVGKCTGDPGGCYADCSGCTDGGGGGGGGGGGEVICGGGCAPYGDCDIPGDRATVVRENDCTGLYLRTYSCDPDPTCGPAQVCTPNSQIGCSIGGCLGTQTCSADGSAWGPCIDNPGDGCPAPCTPQINNAAYSCQSPTTAQVTLTGGISSGSCSLPYRVYRCQGTTCNPQSGTSFDYNGSIFSPIIDSVLKSSLTDWRYIIQNVPANTWSNTWTLNIGSCLLPDLVVTAFSVPSGAPGAAVTAQVTVQNIGDAVAGNFEVAVNRSASSMNCSSAESGASNVFSLNQGASITVPVDIILPSTVGPYTAFAMADSDCAVSEYNDNNNILSASYSVDNINLTATLSVNPSSGTAPLNGVDLTASAGGTAVGTINYTFYCDRSDTGTNITLPADAKFDGIADNPKIAMDVCNYSVGGTYRAKVIVERGGLAAEARQTITVNSPALSASCSVSPSSVSTGQNVTWSASATGGAGFYTYSWSGSAPLGGQTANPANITYTTAGTKTGSVTVTSGAQIAGPIACANSVNVSAELPQADIRANGSDAATLQVAYNSSVTISWCGSPVSNCANATSCSVSKDGALIAGWNTLSASKSSEPLKKDAVFTLTCIGPGGTNSDSVTIDISSSPGVKEIPPN